MKSIYMGALVACVLAAVLIAGGLRPNSGPTVRADIGSSAPERVDDAFVVHEWGTFTSFSGSDGVRLEFRPLLDEDLPQFVLDRGGQAGFPRWLYSKGLISAYQRMETPVTYFYTNRERRIKAQVRFPNGLLTELYPPVASMTPPYDPKKAEPLIDSSLDWGDVWLIPPHLLRPAVADSRFADQLQAQIVDRLLPQVGGENHYGHARATDSALVYVQRPSNPKMPLVPHGDFFEKFLFYRGVGNFSLPLTVESLGGDKFELANNGLDAIGTMFFVTVAGDELRFQTIAGIAAGKRMPLVQATTTATLDELSDAVAAALVAQGLYEKEARAMVNTWRDSWFGEQGTRLFYMVPSRVTDELLPLSIEPRPDETVRVLVGRLEIMSRDDEHAMLAILESRASERIRAIETNPEVAPDLPIPDAIQRLGRLAEPALVRLQHLSADPSVKHEATLLLAQLRSSITSTSSE